MKVIQAKDQGHRHAASVSSSKRSKSTCQDCPDADIFLKWSFS